MTIKESIGWTALWILLGLSFGGVLFWVYQNNVFNINPDKVSAHEALIKYYTGYIVEKSLSLDNIFVIALIFSYFEIHIKQQHRILFWGVIGAIIFRIIFILLGSKFIEEFGWAKFIFGAILLISALKILYDLYKKDDNQKKFDENIGVRLISKLIPFNLESKNKRFFVKENGKWMATRMFAALIVVEFSDILFAFDSIPAIFAITSDSFIIFTSNIFAILGLRSLYFFLAVVVYQFKYLKYSLVIILFYVGLKIMIVQFQPINYYISLGIIVSILGIGILFSIFSKKIEQLPE